MQEHSAEATDIRPFECEHPGCGKSFKQKTHLKSHEKTHDSPYLRAFSAFLPY